MEGELLKSGDFVIIYYNDSLHRGIVITDEVFGSQVYVGIVEDQYLSQQYIDRILIKRIS